MHEDASVVKISWIIQPNRDLKLCWTEDDETFDKIYALFSDLVNT